MIKYKRKKDPQIKKKLTMAATNILFDIEELSLWQRSDISSINCTNIRHHLRTFNGVFLHILNDNAEFVITNAQVYFKAVGSSSIRLNLIGGHLCVSSDSNFLCFVDKSQIQLKPFHTFEIDGKSIEFTDNKYEMETTDLDDDTSDDCYDSDSDEFTD